MEQLLNKITDAGIDLSSVSGKEAIALWEHIFQHIASTNQEKANCLIISAEFHREIKDLSASIEALKQALGLLSLPNDVEDILSIQESLSERLIAIGEYHSALTVYITLTNIAVDYGFIDAYGNALVGMGNLCIIYGDYERALRYYKKLDTIDHALSSRTLRLRYKLYILACLIELKRLEEASELLCECDELSILVSDKNLAAHTHLYRTKLLRMHKQYPDALRAIANIQYSTGSKTPCWLSTMVKIETAYCLNAIGRTLLARVLLDSIGKRIDKYTSPVITKRFYHAKSTIYASQGLFKDALVYEKRAFDIESHLVKHIPIGELGTTQLRRLSRFELPLKLILSEIENRELKKTSKQHKTAVAQLQQDAFTDPLTSLFNRRWLEIKLKDILLHDIPFALMVIDIDHFKSINDELSHLVGDNAITRVSQELMSYFQFKGASCVRFGGEEFLVILENSHAKDVELHAKNYRERIFRHAWQDILGERGLTVSIGITLHRKGENTQRTFYRADKALYRAKANGRNQVCTEL